MFGWLRKLFGSVESVPVPSSADDDVLALVREAQTLRLELAEQEQLIVRLKSDLDRQRAGESQRVDSVVDAGWERLIADASTPLVQLMTQAHLLDVAGKPVQAADVLAVAKRLVRVFETAGVAWEGTFGETLAFDPARHEPLGSEDEWAPGESAVVRFVGVRYREQLIRKARVERASV